MNLQPLYDVQERLEHAAVAGANLLGEDFRLKRAMEGLAPLAAASPVFGKISAALEGLLSAPPEGRGGRLLDALSLVDAVAYTQGKTGCPGALEPLPENHFLVPAKALRDEGTSYHYLPPARFVETDRATRRVIEKCFREKSLPYQECITWTTDGFYRETKQKVLARRAEGCMVVEMECAALAACAEFRGAKFGQFLFTADSLAQVESYDEREWGLSSWKPALLLALDIAAKL